MASKTKPWSSLKHASGNATRIPEYLDGLSSADELIRKASLAELSRTLYRPQKFFTATAKALPALLDLAIAPEVVGRHRVLVLATNLVTAGHHGLLTTGLDLGRTEIKSRYARGAARSIYKVAIVGVPSVLPLLADDDPQVRGAAAFFLAFAFDSRHTVLEALRAHVTEEKNPNALASVAVALGMVAAYSGSDVDNTLVELKGYEHALVRGAAAAARLFRRSSVDDDDVGALLGLVHQGQTGEGFPWGWQRADRLATRMLIDCVPNGRDVAREILLRALRENGTGEFVDEWVGGVLEWTIDERRRWRSASDLEEDERNVVQALADVHAASFSTWGIPVHPADRRRWLGLESPGPLDATLSVNLGDGKREHALAEALPAMVQRGESPVDIHARLAERFDEEELLGIYGEWFAQVYGINPPMLPAFRSLLVEVFEAASSAQRPWAEGMAAYLLDRVHSDWIPGKGRPLLGNLVLAGLYRGTTDEVEPEHEPLLSIGAGDKEVFEKLPLDRREAILTGWLLDPRQPPRTEHVRLIAGARLLPLCPTIPVADAVRRLIAAIKQSPYPSSQQKKALEAGMSALESVDLA